MTASEQERRIVEWHREAMHHADLADEARRRGDPRAFAQHAKKAFELERKASSVAEVEPTRSVLLRSAATLALDANLYRESEKLIATALMGDPPDEIADELRDLWEKVYFHRHLDLRGVAMDPGDFQMSIAGDDVSYGWARSERFLKRTEEMRKLLLRTAARVANETYRDTSAPSKLVRDEVEVYVSVPRAASFAVSFRLARPKAQESMFASIEPKQVIDEVLACFSLLDKSDDAGLRKHFKDDAYYRNFVGLAKQIAPDGRAVKQVGLSGSEETQRVAFRRPSKTISAVSSLPTEASSTTNRLTLRGRLLMADDTKRTSEIAIVGKKGAKTTVKVPSGMMADIVRPMWGADVVAVCQREGTTTTLLEIDRASTDPEES